MLEIKVPFNTEKSHDLTISARVKSDGGLPMPMCIQIDDKKIWLTLEDTKKIVDTIVYLEKMVW